MNIEKLRQGVVKINYIKHTLEELSDAFFITGNKKVCEKLNLLSNELDEGVCDILRAAGIDPMCGTLNM